MWDVHISTVSRCFSTLWIFGLSMTRMIRRGDAPGSWRTELTSNQKAVSRERNTTQLTRKRMCFNLAHQRADSITSIGICSKHCGNSRDLACVRHVWLCCDGAADRCTVLDRCCHCGLGLVELSVLSAQRDSRVDCGQWEFDAGNQTREMGRLVKTLQWQMSKTLSLLSGKPLQLSAVSYCVSLM